MNWFSRYVLSWELSITLEKDFCIEALKRVLLISRPEIFNSDQGPQYTSEEFIGILKDAEIRISMDGRKEGHSLSRQWRGFKVGFLEIFIRGKERGV